MNKSELIDAISEELGDITKADIGKLVDAFRSVVVKSVAKGDSVRLVGFGTFQPKQRQEREVRNPKTGEKMVTPAVVVPSFVAGKQFKEAVKNGGN